MKRNYSKPTIHVEVMSVDMPIAASCEKHSEAFEFRIQGWFSTEEGCAFDADIFNDRDDLSDGICYHSHVNTTFSS